MTIPVVFDQKFAFMCEIHLDLMKEKGAQIKSLTEKVKSSHTHTEIDTVNKLSVAISFKLISGIQIRGNCAGKYQDWIC